MVNAGGDKQMMVMHEREDIRLERSIEDIWVQALAVLAQKVTRPTFETWIRPTKLVELVGDIATVAVCNEFMRTWILNYHVESLVEALSEVLNRKITARLTVDASLQHDSYTPSIGSIAVISPGKNGSAASDEAANMLVSAQAIKTASHSESHQARLTLANLNPKYLFETFVVGSHNRFMHSAATAVAERPGQAYNPLFVYGGVGLGKTHIMQAIGHQVLQNSPKLSVRYISCERFTNELINSIRDDKMIEFRKRYRQVDILLMDDIQFIEGKESTQEEFFHTFNALRDNGRQIVLTSDRPPKSLSLLEERLRSRFEWGLIADIQTPDLETRTAILRKKSELENMHVPDDVLEYIASLFTTNIRELEGALIRSHAYSSLTGAPLSVANIKAVLQPAGPTQAKPSLSLDQIIYAVASHFRVETSELRSAKRSQDLALPRHIAMYLAHDLLQVSFPRIGEAFGNRKHTSALYAHNRIKEAIPKNLAIAEAIKQITRQLSN